MATELTIDICILRSASQTGDTAHFQPSINLLKSMATRSGILLCLDSRGKIDEQYLRHMKHGTFGHQWYILMISKNRCAHIEWTNLDRGVRTALKEAHFDSSTGEDYKYVITAAGSATKLIVSHDPDYSPEVRRILRKRLEVRVCAASDFV